MIEIDPTSKVALGRLLLPFEQRLLHLTWELENRGSRQPRQAAFRKLRLELRPYPPALGAALYQSLVNME